MLWARKAILEAMPPWQGGGNMIVDVTFERTVSAAPPARFEAGTPHISGVVGLGAALDWLEEVGLPAVVRPSFAADNCADDVDALAEALVELAGT